MDKTNKNIFDSKILHKVVVKESDTLPVKALRGYIIDTDENYITLQFPDKTKVFVNHNSVVTIMEVSR